MKLYLLAMLAFVSAAASAANPPAAATPPPASAAPAASTAPVTGPSPFRDNSGAFESADDIYTFCTDSSLRSKGYCEGYITGVTDVAAGLKSLAICIPSKLMARDIVDEIRKYLTEHPDERQFTGYTKLISVLMQAYPCAKPN